MTGTRRHRRAHGALRAPLLLALLGLLSLAGPASADLDPFDRSGGLPKTLRYERAVQLMPQLSLRNDRELAVDVPTRFKRSSILKYSTPIGDTGLIFQVKARPNPKRIVKFEIRF